MEAVVNETGVLRPWLQKLAEFFPISRRSELERELSEAKAQTGRQKKHTERVQQRYGLLDKRYAALSNEADGLRSRLYAAERQTEAFKAVVKALCTAVGTAEDLKRIYQVAASYLDDGGFNLFDAAQEITGFRLGREFPYEDACGCFEFLDGFELLRYLKASEFGAVIWEPVPETDCRKAVLGEVDESTPAFREFERQLYRRALERLGLWVAASPMQARQV